MADQAFISSQACGKDVFLAYALTGEDASATHLLPVKLFTAWAACQLTTDRLQYITDASLPTSPTGLDIGAANLLHIHCKATEPNHQ